MDAPVMIAATLGEQIPNISLESIRNVVLTSGFLLSLIGFIYSKKSQRFRLTYMLYAASMSLLATYFIITTLLEGIYITLLLLGLVIFLAGVLQIVLSPPLATQKQLIVGIVSLIIAGLILMFSYASLLEQIR
jgi:uncharacterized membrane protein HdeD (DUF308 family)